MISAYECLANPTDYAQALGQALPLAPPGPKVWPHQTGVWLQRLALRSPRAEEAVTPAPASLPTTEWAAGFFGLAPRWAKSLSDAKLRGTKLVNAPAESVAKSRPFEAAWREGQRAIVPMAAFFVDDWRSGRPVPTRIARVDGKALCVAGLWERWEKDGEERLSFCLLTINANGHGLMHRYGPPGADRRMLAILGDGARDAWLTAHPDKARELLRPFAAQSLLANPVEKKPKPHPARSPVPAPTAPPTPLNPPAAPTGPG